MTNVQRRSAKAKALQSYRTFKVRAEARESLIRKYYQSLDTPVSLSCWLLYEAGEHAQLVDKGVSPEDYNSAESFRLDFTAISFLRKCAGLKTGIDTQKVALDAFDSCEIKCEATNRKFSNLGLCSDYSGANVWLLNATQRKIAEILGTYKPSEFFENGAWGPGSTTSIGGSDTSAVRKFDSELSISSKLYRLVSPSLSYEYPNWFPTDASVEALKISDVSKMLTVPKNAKTDRAIAIEPGINSWFQKSLGLSIRHRLRRSGYDLNRDDWNQHMARIGSNTGAVATVDFSSASDTIAYKLVREILPADWFFVLDACRTPSYKRPDGSIQNSQKFSSMGNGYTFELESLIFVAAALAVSEYLGLDTYCVSVFGDDITIGTEAFGLYTEFAAFLGFTVNRAKSYASTPFRESCGSFYYNGVNCKPLFQKEILDDAKSIFRLANSVRSMAHRYNDGDGCAIRYRSLHRSIVAVLPIDLAVMRGAVSMGDGCIHSNFDECTPSLAKDGWQGYLQPAFVESPVLLESRGAGVLLTRLWYRSTENDAGNSYSLRRVTRSKLKTLIVFDWYNLGPWV